MTRIMFDSVNVDAFPDPAKVPFDATAGYVNGRYKNSDAIRKRFPNLPHLSITVFASGDADCLDVEPGDAEPSEVPAWLDRQYTLGRAKPTLYCNTSQIAAVRAAVGARPYWWWAARYATPRVSGLISGSDATQWNDSGPNGENVDQSVITDAFYASLQGGTDMPLTDADVAKILDAPITRQGKGQSGTTTLRDVAAYSDANQAGSRDTILAAVKALATPAAAVVDYAALAKAVNDDAAKRMQF